MIDLNRDIAKKEASILEGQRQTKSHRVFKPSVDILERKNETLVFADMPGVDEKSLDITLEKNILTIRGGVESAIPAEYGRLFSEYPIGDYERIFTLSDDVDRDKIQATVKNGVLCLSLPKFEEVKTKKILVKAEA